MIWVSTQPGAFPVIYIDEERAGVGAIESANGVSHFLHSFDYIVLGLYLSVSQAKRESAARRQHQKEWWDTIVGYNRSEGGLMRYVVGVVLFLSVGAAAFGQVPGSHATIGGYSNVLLPGVAHPQLSTAAAF